MSKKTGCWLRMSQNVVTQLGHTHREGTKSLSQVHKEGREDASSGSLILIPGFLPVRFYPIRYQVPHPPFVSHAIIFAFFMQRKEFQCSVHERKKNLFLLMRTCES